MSLRVRIHENLQWPYDEAIAWMDRRVLEVQAGHHMWLGVGSHAEPVLTLGRHAPPAQILSSESWQAKGGLVRRIDRGGGATAHNPGQVVLYPIVSLRQLRLDIPGFTFALEEAAIRLLAELDVKGSRQTDAPGVFVGDAKIASVGFRVQHGVVKHGMSLNCCNDVSIFQEIEPCGIPNAPVTSLKQLHKVSELDLEKIARRLCAHLAEICVLDCDAVVSEPETENGTPGHQIQKSPATTMGDS